MSVDKTLKALGLRKKTPGDKVREAGANLNARFAKLRGATPESARAAGARFGLDRRPVILAALWAFAALPWFNARWTGSVTPAGLAPLVLGQALSMQDKIATRRSRGSEPCAAASGASRTSRRSRSSSRSATTRRRRRGARPDPRPTHDPRPRAPI